MGGGQTTELFTQHLTQHLKVRTRSGLGTQAGRNQESGMQFANRN